MNFIYKLAGLIAICIIALVSLGMYLSPQDEPVPADAIVAISGDDGSRLKTAIRLQKAGWANRLIFSGAALDPQSPSNAITMKQTAVASGVDPALISIDEEAVSTRQNAIFSAKIINDLKLERIILVTSPFHQRRAFYEFHKALGPDVDIINYSAQDSDWNRTRWWTNPTSWRFTLTELPKLVISQLR